jgi:flagellin-like hook-associated protein FlgL
MIKNSLGTKNTYEYFDDPDPVNRTNTSFDKYEFQLFTAPSGEADDGNIKLNIINLQMLLGIKDPSAIDSDLSIAKVPLAGGPPTLSIGSTLNLGGFNQPTLTDTEDIDKLTNNTGTGYIKDITEISIEEFTNIIEKVADARAENGAEQQRVNQSMKLQQNNLVNLEAAHGRIMDTDVALESTRLARHSVKVQASAAMVAQANQMTSIALTLLQ